MTDTAATDRYAPHEGGCCPCVARLREQNKASSDDWTKRTAAMQSALLGLQHLLATAARMNHERKDAHGLITGGLSRLGQACIAAALMEADDAVAELEAVRREFLAERRLRIAVEARLVECREGRPQRPRANPGAEQTAGEVNDEGS